MDPFQSYLLDKIIDYRGKVNNQENEDIKWAMGNCLEELLEVFSEYDLNYKL